MAAQPSAALLKRIRDTRLHDKIVAAEETIPHFRNGMNLGFSGFAEGNPKLVPELLAEHVKRSGLAGKMRFNVYTAASIGAELDELWSNAGMIDQRWAYQLGAAIRKAVNEGRVDYGDRHLSMFAQDFGYGFYTPDDAKLDIGIVEASCITEEGAIVPTLSVGLIPEIVQHAEKIIVEVNTLMPSFEGLHDCVGVDLPPNKKVYPITRVDDRIGSTSIPCDPRKIVAIVESRMQPAGRQLGPADEKTSTQIARHIIDFLQFEVKKGRLPANLLPLQSGVGTIANAVIGGLLDSSFTNLTVWTEVMQDNLLDLIDAGKLDFVSAASYTFTENGLKRFFANWENYTAKSLLRSGQITNHAEVVRRLGVIAMNTPVEFDIYAHVNSSILNGSGIINGIGGSGDFMRNAYLSIMHTPSTRPTRTDRNGISCVVPMVTHVDHTEHDMDILVTEQGLADLRGLTPKARAQRIIDTCAHPEYRPILRDYFDRSLKECLASRAAHMPHMLHKVFKMQKNLEERGTMKIDNWD